MKAVAIKELKTELENLSPKVLREICLRLSKFKKENKELLTYLLFESFDEAAYIENVKKEVDEQFEKINKKSNYIIKKALRKIFLNVKKYSRYSQNKQTEIDLLLYYCFKLKNFKPSIYNSTRLLNIYTGLIGLIRKKLALLHEDLQFDLGQELKTLTGAD